MHLQILFIVSSFKSEFDRDIVSGVNSVFYDDIVSHLASVLNLFKYIISEMLSVVSSVVANF